MLTQLLTYLGHYSTGIDAAFKLLMMGIGAGLFVRIRPIITAIIDRARLVAQLEAKDVRIKELEIERERLLKSLEAAGSTNDGWRESVEQLSYKIKELEKKVAEGTARQEASDALHIISTRYIIDLLMYIRRAKWDEQPPLIPSELRNSVTLPRNGS